MNDLIASMMKFSTAMTLFSMQQLQNAVGAAADSQQAMSKFREALEAMTGAVTTQMDESKKATLDSMSKVQKDLMDRTMDAMHVDAFDPREIIQTTGDMMRKTTDAMSELVKKATAAGEKVVVGEPQAAVEALK